MEKPMCVRYSVESTVYVFAKHAEFLNCYIA